jgi:hypothetical protein
MNKQITELVHELSLIKQVDAIFLAGWINNALKEVLLKHNAGLGFILCFWHNLLHSKILFDREENAAKIKNKYSKPIMYQDRCRIKNKSRDDYEIQLGVQTECLTEGSSAQ